jgi:hypothetical protein
MATKAKDLLWLYRLRVKRFHERVKNGLPISAEGLRFCEQMLAGLQDLEPEECVENTTEVTDAGTTRCSFTAKGYTFAVLELPADNDSRDTSAERLD